MKILLIIPLTLLLLSCSDFDGFGFAVSSCDEKELAKVDKYKCETDDECVSKFDDTYVCVESKEYYKQKSKSDCEVVITPEGQFCSIAIPRKQCVKDYCKYDNIDCGFGTCNLYVGNIGQGGYNCDCENGYLHKEYEDGSIKCIENSCENSLFCKYTYIKTETETLYTDLCSGEGKCSEHCSNHFDCKGEFEFCDQSTRCIDLKTIQCSEDEYVDPYYTKYLSYIEGIFCSKKCDETNLCQAGFICNQNQQCVPKCTTNEQCRQDKFTGNTCNIQLHYCE